MAKPETMETLRAELKASADGGAGLLELLDQLQTANRRFGRRSRLSDDELDELSLYCWMLQTSKPRELVSERADELWGSLRAGTPTGRQRFRRRARTPG